MNYLKFWDWLLVIIQMPLPRSTYREHRIHGCRWTLIYDIISYTGYLEKWSLYVPLCEASSPLQDYYKKGTTCGYGKIPKIITKAYIDKAFCEGFLKGFWGHFEYIWKCCIEREFTPQFLIYFLLVFVLMQRWLYRVLTRNLWQQI